MKSLVVYFSKDGKTRKVAEAIAQELNCEAIDVKKKSQIFQL
jgi:flavodoxin